MNTRCLRVTWCLRGRSVYNSTMISILNLDCVVPLKARQRRVTQFAPIPGLVTLPHTSVATHFTVNPSLVRDGLRESPLGEAQGEFCGTDNMAVAWALETL